MTRQRKPVYMWLLRCVKLFVVYAYNKQVISHDHVISNCLGKVSVFIQNAASDFITFIYEYVMLFMLQAV